MNGCIMLRDFADNSNDDGSNASDDDFTMDDEYRNEMIDEAKLEMAEGIIGNDDPDLQEDYFQNPIQHDTNVNDNNEPDSVITRKSKRGINRTQY
jgi:hypothetical protein